MSKSNEFKESIVKEVKSGFLKLVILKILHEESLHGYAIIKKIKITTKHKWTPSSGSIYPALKILEKHRLLKSTLEKNKRVYTITAEGKKFFKNITFEMKDGIEDLQAIFCDKNDI